MENQGKIVEVFPLRSGQTARGSWCIQEYLLETIEQYPKKMLFAVSGEDRIKRFDLHKGQLVAVSIDIDAREYNGRWYNSIRAYDVRVINNPNAPTQSQQNSNVVYAKNAANEQPNDDLPF